MFSHEAFETAEIIAVQGRPTQIPKGVSLATRRYRDNYFQVCHVTQHGAEVALRGLYGTAKAANSALVSILEHVMRDFEVAPEEAITRLYK